MPRFLSRFGEGYGSLGTADTVIAAAAAHHRLVWIHPFLDGNGLNHLSPKSGEILQAVLCRGELPRADAPGIVGTGERQARRIVSALLDQSVLISESARAPLRLAFPAALAPRRMPGLFPERTG